MQLNSQTITENEDASARLAELGLSRELLFKASLRADAEAKLSTDLDAPTHAGTTRFSRTTRFLREAMIPVGWDYDNSRNYCRMIDPNGAFSVVVSSGDQGTGVVIPGNIVGRPGIRRAKSLSKRSKPTCSSSSSSATSSRRRRGRRQRRSFGTCCSESPAARSSLSSLCQLRSRTA